jgi:hypothetical protein
MNVLRISVLGVMGSSRQGQQPQGEEPTDRNPETRTGKRGRGRGYSLTGVQHREEQSSCQ